jgi:hypothetical protein
MNNYRKYTPVEAYINQYDSSVLWNYIPTFNGYEISNNGYVRSMKHFRKYPFGMLIHPVIPGNDPTYELTNDNNERVRMKFSELLSLSQNNKYVIAGYPRKTCISDNHSRNKVISKKPKENPLEGKMLEGSYFTIIPD